MIRALLSNLIKVSLVVALLIVIAHTISDAMQDQRPNSVELLVTRSATAPATALPQLVDLNEPEQEVETDTEQMLLIFREIRAEPAPEPLVYTALTRVELDRASSDGLWQETGLSNNPLVRFSNLLLQPTATPTYIRPTITPSVEVSVTPRPTGIIIVQDNVPGRGGDQEQPAAQPQPAQPPVAANPDVGEAVQSPPTQVPPTSVPPTSVPPTSVPPTAVPPTAVPPTAVPPTPVPPTAVPPTSVPPTPVPPTPVPPTPEPPPPVIEPPPPPPPEQPPQQPPSNDRGGRNSDDDDDDEGDRGRGRDSNNGRGRGRGSGRGS